MKRAAIQAIQENAHRVVHPTAAREQARQAIGRGERFNLWLADHIVTVAGSMAFFYTLLVLLIAWSIGQTTAGQRAFDPYPFSFLFFILGGIMQSLFVPTMLVAANRAAAREEVKWEADHKAMQEILHAIDALTATVERMV